VTTAECAGRSDRPLLDRLERYYDATPRNSARAEDFGPLTLFVRYAPGWPYYARPTLDARGARITPADVDRVRARQRELDVPEAFEWVAETTPTLAAAIEGTGLVVHAHPLMVTCSAVHAPDPAGVRVRVLDADDPWLPSALALPHVAFASPGSAVGMAGLGELARARDLIVTDGSVAHTTARVRVGLTVVAAAIDTMGNVLCAGQHQPVDDVSEVVGVGTLPVARRRGLALAVTAALVTDARARGVDLVFLAAGDADIARNYARLGFIPCATAMIAEPD